MTNSKNVFKVDMSGVTMERVSFSPWTFTLNPSDMIAQVIHAARHPRADP